MFLIFQFEVFLATNHQYAKLINGFVKNTIYQLIKQITRFFFKPAKTFLRNVNVPALGKFSRNAVLPSKLGYK